MIGIILLLLLATSLYSQTDAEIRTILAGRIDNAKQSVGIVVGIVDADGRRVVSYGRFDSGDNRPLNGDTVFEIGSVTKVFTSLLLADMAQRGEVALTDPVSKYLPPEVKIPERDGKQIRLIDLATHTSALPRLPDNMHPADATNPYADYSVEQMYQFLSAHTLRRDIGARYEYSNLGVGLLGHALARRAGKSYEALVRERICVPLGMKDTRIELTPEMRARLTPGHDSGLKAAPNWDLPTLAGAGAIRSTANDMMSFLAAFLGYTKTPLAPAMEAMLTPRRPTGGPDLEIALAWHIVTRDGTEVIWHNGGTGGYRTYIGYNPKTRRGVVALSNTSTAAGVDDIGRHLLDPGAPLLKFQPPKERKEITLAPKALEGFVGRYEAAPTFVLTVTREDNRLFVQATGQPKFEVFAEGERDFFLKAVDAQITFEADRLVLHQNGRNTPAKRLE